MVILYIYFVIYINTLEDFSFVCLCFCCPACMCAFDVSWGGGGCVKKLLLLFPFLATFFPSFLAPPCLVELIKQYHRDGQIH